MPRKKRKTLAPTFRKWHDHPAWQTILSTVSGGLSGAVSVVGFISGKSAVLSLVSASSAIFAIASGWAKGRTEVAAEAEKVVPYAGIEACMFTITDIVSDLKGLPSDQNWSLRGTIHAPSDDDRQDLVQCLNYTGGGNDGIGRRMRNHCGVTGKAFADRKPVLFERTGSNTDQFHQELQAGFGFSSEEVKRLRPDRRCAFAVPIFGENDRSVLGVAYFDSDITGFFDEAVQNIILRGCGGLTRYIAAKAEK